MSSRTMLWLTDRSRYETALDKCQRDRFLGYHFGPSGYGIQRKAQSIPLAAGIYYHAGLEFVLRWVKDHDQQPPDEVIRAGVKAAVDAYDQVITLRGLRGLDQGQRLDLVITEQQYLIEGLIWAFCLTTLPWILQQCRVVEVEREEVLVCGCTCGLGEGIGSIEDHEQRGCEGIGFQSRPDWLTEYRARPGVYAYWEFKGVGSVNEPWETQWETKIQFSAGVLGAQARLGITIQEAYVVGLIKGRREGDTYNPETGKREGEYRQQSIFCYGYKRPANPPLEPEDWQPSFNYKDEQGGNRRLGKAYQKAGLWTLAESHPELQGSAVSIGEFWAKWIPKEILGKQITLIGPLNISPVLNNDLIEELVAEETRWKGIVWELHQVLVENGFEWTSAPYQAALRRLVPRSWSCRRYGKRHECQFVKICFAHEGWQTAPMDTDQFLPRRPHHEAELAQVEARGLAPVGGWADDEERD